MRAFKSSRSQGETEEDQIQMEESLPAPMSTKAAYYKTQFTRDLRIGKTPSVTQLVRPNSNRPQSHREIGDFSKLALS